MTWEIVDIEQTDREEFLKTEKVGIPGGWLVRLITTREDKIISSSITFVADPNYKWRTAPRGA